MNDIHPHVKFAMEHNGAYSEAELESLRKLVEELESGSRIVEIGVLYGRSACIYLQAALEKELHITLIDNWCVNGPDAKVAFHKLLGSRFLPVTLLEMTSIEAADMVPNGIDLLHIDGDHSPEGITADCGLYLPKLKSGKVALFHDYATKDIEGVTLVYPQIEKVVNDFTKGWEDLGVIDRVAVRRKHYEEKI